MLIIVIYHIMKAYSELRHYNVCEGRKKNMLPTTINNIYLKNV